MKKSDQKTTTDAALFAATTTPDLGIPYGSCLLEDSPDPCMIVVIGASGDLTARKLMPALYNLYLKDALPDPFVIVGCSRSDFSDEGFREKMGVSLREKGAMDESKWESFASRLFYRSIQYDDPSSFSALARNLNELDMRYHTAGNRLFYLAIPPFLYETIARALGEAGLSAGTGENEPWSRVVVEKPFGSDLETAVALNRTLHSHFQEKQVFRIDHYLAKETVQNILMFRFANAVFEPVWNRTYIGSVSIISAETLGVEHRAGYYEQAGVLRDMFQNHMMQLLALIAMETPSRFEADQVRDEKVKVYRALRPFPVDNINDFIVLGQYGLGTIDNHEVPGYRDEPGVDPHSLTPTYAKMKVFIDNWRWQGVPFYLTSGKRLARKVTEISIQLKEVPHSMFRNVLGEHITANRLILGIYPDEKISLTFQTKNPGAKVCLRSVTMDFYYRQNYTGPVLDAYEKVLLDCMLGDHMLFWRQDGVELCWSFLTPILQSCESCANLPDMLRIYESGSWGPPSDADPTTEVAHS
ncbi:MAG: glucose-6-phosphate dehydrogenase [Deltaproteobacteria bacterium]|nr:glucose-6-phosphate dehydrogenase [Deltaproteobacteria bacterium]